MEFKDLIHNRRKQLGLTMEEIAKVCNVSKATVQRWESGEIANIRRDKISNLAKALHTTPAYLMGWEESETELNQSQIQTKSKEHAKLVEAINKLTDEQVQQALDYIDYLISKRNQ